MSEADAIAQVQAPGTVDSLCGDLLSLGVRDGMTMGNLSDPAKWQNPPVPED